MLRIGAYEAKTRLAALLDRVEAGERITITRHGRAVAVLVPSAEVRDRPVEDAIEDILAARRGQRLGDGLTVVDLIAEGRR